MMLVLTATLAGCGPAGEVAEVSDELSSGSAVCGARVGAAYEGVYAQSNSTCVWPNACSCKCATGNCDTGYGVGYQCVELAMRFWAQKYATFWRDNAWGLFDDAIGRCDTWASPNGAKASADWRPPTPGDMVVWGRRNDGWGHVAVITAVGARTIDIMEQNVAAAAYTPTNGVGHLAWDPNRGLISGTSWASSPSPAGWLHAYHNVEHPWPAGYRWNGCHP